MEIKLNTKYPYHDNVNMVIKEVLRLAYIECNGSRTLMAEKLKITRNTIHKYLKQFPEIIDLAEKEIKCQN